MNYNKNYEKIYKMNRLKNYCPAGPERGAASVLVVFMMIILVTFGTLSLTASLANIRLGEKTVTWMDSFYNMDSEAERLCMEVDACLLMAENAAIAALPTGGFDELYYQEANRALRELASSHTSVTVNGQGSSTQVEIHLSKGSEPGSHNLDVVLSLVKPEFILVQDPSGQPGWRRADSFMKHYNVLKWQEWQAPFEFEEAVSFWDGTIPL